ncbi:MULTISPECIES: type 1 fimbrial major subunit FimA [Proteus]|uniref:Type 1 fimbrial major subunit FimA n=1 Tax=Proteus appendicitidis TaxID=3034648 RepID=A0ABY8Y3E9_9GAMM|nr:MULTISPECIES: type 1 fimbrial major subunit FimA [unclassified Proteus (in: enterobacteria)]QEZ92440.1 type-1 fimbrial protein subunit A [Proteus sp. CD3]WIV86925.1 type 1 fimbrial major subunit FimA [Proteus sp. HZ0627]
MFKKNTLIKTVLAVSILSASSLATAATVVNGGKINFTGQIVNAACAVSAKSMNQTINIGQYRTAQFDVVGKTVGDTNFSIDLADCDTTVAKNASASFSGVSDANDKTILAVSNITTGGSGAATGVGIELIDHTGKVLTPDGSVFSTAKQLINGANTLDFVARYKSTLDTVTPGHADANVTFKMQYD